MKRVGELIRMGGMVGRCVVKRVGEVIRMDRMVRWCVVKRVGEVITMGSVVRVVCSEKGGRGDAGKRGMVIRMREMR